MASPLAFGQIGAFDPQVEAFAAYVEIIHLL